MVVQEQAVIEGWRGVLVSCGLRTPTQRAITAALLTGAFSYAAKIPKRAFRENGSIRPLKGSADSTDCHFFLCPVCVGVAVFLFT